MKKKAEKPEEIREALKQEAPEETPVQAEEMAEEKTEETAASPAGEKEKGAEGDALAEDVAMFHTLFPDVPADKIPGAVWEAVEAGESLTAAYAVHFVQEMRDKERIERLNEENAKAAPPPVRHDGKEESYFSPEAVKAMSREEVRKNYQEILRSMDHWN